MSLRFKSVVFLVAALAVSFGGTAHAQKWGDLTAKFVIDGTPPKAEKMAPTKDQEVCKSTTSSTRKSWPARTASWRTW